MHVLWTEGPSNVQHVQERLLPSDELAYNTVHAHAEGCSCFYSRKTPATFYSTQLTWMRSWRVTQSRRRLPRIDRGARVPRNAK